MTGQDGRQGTGEPDPPELSEEEIAAWLAGPARLAMARWSGHLAEEPSTGLLPAGEGWRPRTFAHFRIALLRHLEKGGAQTRAEIEASPPEVLGLPLSATEIAATLESARRRGLVERLDADGRSGPVGPEDEWAVTERGGKLARRGVQWVLPHVGSATTLVLSILGAVLTIAGAKLSIKGGAGQVVFLAALVLLAAAVLVAAVVWHRDLRTGAAWAKGPVAEDWIRWGRKFPDLRETALRPFPRWWALLSVALIAVGLVAPALLLDGFWAEAGIVVGTLTGWVVLLATAGSWLTRWGDVKVELKMRRMLDLLEDLQAEEAAWAAEHGGLAEREAGEPS